MKNYTISNEDLIMDWANTQVDVDRLGKALEEFRTITEATVLPDEGDESDVFSRFKDIAHMMDGAKRGLGITNKIKDPAMKAKHKSQIMSNMNRIRGAIRRLEKEMAGHWAEWSKGSTDRTDGAAQDV